ncbi:hypothetical protein AK88_04955 [Plasmodium fragile]|uniref:Uncharacterized protein n=1 Tax=Plasmodium fragile TaxID=5857 RepID=A0A0D9QI68_PLAFR|nr:uncharacterized protein AK88_04955 [Plasmodium fragile]KJP85416.1 hypothetical protein AK88_04955 [Plasmodium fragile]
MFLKSAVLFFLVHVFITCTKCHSYFLKNKYFENVFFVNSHIEDFSKNDEKKAVKIQRNRKRGVFYVPHKIYAPGRRCVHRRVRKRGGHSSTRCFFKSNGGVSLFPRGGKCGSDTRLISLAGGDDWVRARRRSKLLSNNFEKVFNENFDESSRLKKSELISILACICTNIVIEYLKIKEEKKTEDFEYPFDYSLMNILKLVNFEYDVNEELEKKKKKQKKEFNRRKFKGGGGVQMGTMGDGILGGSDEGSEKGVGRNRSRENKSGEPCLVGSLNEGVYAQTEEEVNINIDNQNTKEENAKLDEYIKMMEFNTMQIKDIAPYIDLFFGKNTFEKVFLKNGIDVQKIYDKLSEALFDKCQEKANVMELQKFVEHEERIFHKRKKVHVRNGSMSFDDYMEGLGSLEESKGVREVEQILYDGEVPSDDGEFTSEGGMKKKKKKKKNKKNGNFINGLGSSGGRDGDHLGFDLGDGPHTDGDSPDGGSSGGGRVNRSGGPGVEDSAASTSRGNDNDGGEGHDGGQDNFSGAGHERRHEQFDGEEEQKEGRGRSGNRGGVEFLNGISYALIKGETEMEAKGDVVEDSIVDASGDPQSNIVLIKFVYDKKYACEFRTDIGVIAYERLGTKSPDDAKEDVKKMYSRVCGGDILSDSDLIRGGPFKHVLENVNFEELYEIPYKKRFARKQSIIRDMNTSVVAQQGVRDIDAYPLLYGYLKVWEEDLHCYELNKVEIRHMCGVEQEGKRGGDNMLNGKIKYNFFRNYDEDDRADHLTDDRADGVLIDSDRYRQIVGEKDDKANEKMYDFVENGDFSNNDYISFKDKLFINNRKEINCYEDLIAKLRWDNSNLSVYVLSRLKNMEEDLSFVSGEEFLKNYTFDEEDEFLNLNKIVHRCIVESRYHSMFRNEGGGLKGGERNSKLFCHYDGFSGGKRREGALRNVRERNVFGLQLRTGLTRLLPPSTERTLSIDAKVNDEERCKKKQQKGRKKKKKKSVMIW